MIIYLQDMGVVDHRRLDMIKTIGGIGGAGEVAGTTMNTTPITKYIYTIEDSFFEDNANIVSITKFEFNIHAIHYL